jgi:hypothetical protein
MKRKKRKKMIWLLRDVASELDSVDELRGMHEDAVRVYGDMSKAAE